MQAKNDWLQALRGIAALMILFYHARPYWAMEPSLQPAVSMLQWGFAGVDIFFVLSGYVVYQSADRNAFHAPAFLIRRGLRIYLGYWPALVLLLTSTLLFNLKIPEVNKLIASTLLLSPSLFDNWLPTAWSLTYELYFYLWIAVILGFRGLSGGKMLLLFGSVLLAWNIGCYVLSPATVLSGHQPLRFTLTGLGLEFLAGAGWAHLRKRHPLLKAHPLALVLLGGILVGTGFATGTSSPLFDKVELLRATTYGLVGIGSLLMALSMADLRWKVPQLFVSVGDASYGLYLIHPVLIDILGTVFFRFLGPGHSWTLICFLLAPVLIVSLSIVWYRRIEKPLFESVTASTFVKNLTVKPT